MAHAAFATRIADSRGAPEVFQAAYLIEQALEIPGLLDPIYLARERGAGVRTWLKHAGDKDGGARIANEARLLSRLEHPHIIQAVHSELAAQPPWLAYAWQAESPLNNLRLQGFAPVDRSRLALELLETIGYLQGLAEPVAHCKLELASLWVTPELGWLRLAQFGQAVAGAGHDELQADRSSAVRLVLQLAQPDGGAGPALESAAQEWIDHGEDALLELKHVLRLLALARIAADL